MLYRSEILYFSLEVKIQDRDGWYGGEGIGTNVFNSMQCSFAEVAGKRHRLQTVWWPICQELAILVQHLAGVSLINPTTSGNAERFVIFY